MSQPCWSGAAAHRRSLDRAGRTIITVAALLAALLAVTTPCRADGAKGSARNVEVDTEDLFGFVEGGHRGRAPLRCMLPAASPCMFAAEVTAAIRRIRFAGLMLSIFADAANYAISLAVAKSVASGAGGASERHDTDRWICSRNDAIGNLTVLSAAAGVFGTGTGWPDIIVAATMAALALWGSCQIIRMRCLNWALGVLLSSLV
jgi:hypothetical protein